ncbi:MAG TPA: SRPBCC family protein [Candidatus Limnocylindria bacterium]|nr:SRPBCC family protein [Candidatus Limnocylindria bacterium]
MIRYSSDVTIRRSPSDVLDALLDPDLYPKWTPMVDVAFDGRGRPGPGTTGRFRMAEGPIKGMLEMRIAELDPDRRLVIKVSHPSLHWTAISTVSPDGSGTRLTYAGELEFKGWRRLLEPLMAGEVRNGEAQEALRLKSLLEAEKPSAAMA